MLLFSYQDFNESKCLCRCHGGHQLWRGRMDEARTHAPLVAFSYFNKQAGPIVHCQPCLLLLLLILCSAHSTI